MASLSILTAENLFLQTILLVQAQKRKMCLDLDSRDDEKRVECVFAFIYIYLSKMAVLSVQFM
jgi:hypothetical protein